jgi:hypothetical protein
METKKDLIGNELMREILSIRVDSLWRMLALKKQGRLPQVDEEGATGVFDNKGAMFIPGSFVFEDSDRKPIVKENIDHLTEKEFRDNIRASMRHDNATLIYENGLAPAVNLDNGFFADMAGRIIAVKQAALKRKSILKMDPPEKFTSNHVTRSYCPSFISPPYGSRTKLSSCMAACLIEPRLYYLLCRNEFGLRGEEEKSFWEAIRASQKPIFDREGKVLAGPYIVVCHATRYRKEILTGIVRILGFGHFGEFAVLTLEETSNDLLRELDDNRTEFIPGDIVAEYEGTRVVCVLRVFPPTTPGKRLLRTTTTLVSPTKDLSLDLEKISEEARKRYGLV